MNDTSLPDPGPGAGIDRWREAAVGAGLGVFERDLVAGKVWRSPELLARWDYPVSIDDSPGDAKSVIHPADHVRYERRLLDLDADGSGGASIELRMRARDGSWRWVRWTARVVGRDAAGKPTRVIGSVTDIHELHEAAERARESQLRLQGIVDSAMDAIISIDEDQHITLFNRAAERIFGYASHEVMGQPLTMLMPERFQLQHRTHVEGFGHTGISSRPMMSQRIVSALRKGGEEFPIDASISQSSLGRGRVFTVILRDVSIRERTQRELAQAREDLRELSVASRTAREQENSRISRELHDELGQNLTSLKMDLAWLEANTPPDDARVKRTLAAMRSVLDSTVAATRRISADLRPLMLDDLGLAAALEWLVEETSRRHGFTVELKVDEVSANIAEPLASQIYRIVQESLTNAGRHAAARQVRVHVRAIGPEIHLDVQDDGRGISPEDLRKKGSFGLVGIRERVYILAGAVEMRGDPGRGTALHVRLPIPGEAKPA